jgi:ABC-type sugar transport system ATPase subunit
MRARLKAVGSKLRESQRVRMVAEAAEEGSVSVTRAVLTLRDIRRTYGATVAVSDLSLDLSVGQVHAIVGENGAGKSTVAQIAAGVVQPSSGQVRFQEQTAGFRSAREAEAHGVVLIPQELQLYESLSVAENLYVGRDRPRGAFGVVRTGEMRRRARQIFDRLGVRIDPSEPLESLSPASRQVVAIARALVLDARVLIMDEPTAALDEWEAQRLLRVVRDLRATGVAVLYVSHRLNEVMQIADLITVMRDGQVVITGPARQFNEATLVRHMLGRSIEQFARKIVPVKKGVALETSHLTRAGFFTDVNMQLRYGEVLGIAGLVGSGRSAFAQTLFGFAKPTSGTVSIDGNPVRSNSIRRIVAAGLGYVPEERQSQGLFMPLSVRDNVSLPALERFRRAGLISRSKEHTFVERALARFQLRGTLDDPVSSLSGGNQQKVLLARWLALTPKVLILDEPTHGIDMGVRTEIYRLIDQLIGDGIAVLLISSEIEELLVLADRVAVMREGALVAEFAGDELTALNIGSAALGSSSEPDS